MPTEQLAQRRQAQHMFDMAGQEQLMHHVERQQRGHAVIAEPLPAFGEGEIEEPARMAGKLSFRGVKPVRAGYFFGKNRGFKWGGKLSAGKAERQQVKRGKGE